MPAGYNKLNVMVRMEIGSESVRLSYIGTTGNPDGIYNEPVKADGAWNVTIGNTTGAGLLIVKRRT